MRNTPPPTRRVRAAHESKSATVRAAAAAPSRRQQSKWQREQHQQHRLYIAVGALLVVVAGIFLGGLYYDNVVRANEVIAQIGPDSVNAAQLLGEVKPAARSLDTQAKQFGGGSNIAQYVDQQKRSLPDQTTPAARFVTRGRAFRDFLPDTPSGVVRDSWHNGVGGGLRLYLRGVILPLLGVDFAYGIEGNDFQWYLSIGSTLD